MLPLGAQTVAPPSAPRLSPDQVDTLVAPIALYPDPLLGQVLAASTYPLELVEAQQWMQQRRDLRGPQLIEAARQQNWDASVQAMVAFPDVLALLTRDVGWTTDLGNAFLVQQADVMASVQRMRARAQSNGALQTTPQQTVTAQVDNGQSAIAIQPANPQVIYVPTYNPAFVWGPPAWGAYPSLNYPASGFGFDPAVFLGSLFTGLLSFGGWGWGLNWLSHGLLFLNSLFFSHFGFGGGGIAGGLGGTSAWTHNPAHRLGVAYPSQVAARFEQRSRFAGSQWRTFNNEHTVNNARMFSSPSSSQGWHGFQGGYRGAPAAENYRGVSNSSYRQSDRSFSNGATRGSSNFAPQRMASDFRSSERSTRNAPGVASQHFSAPHSKGPGSKGGHSSAPRASSHSGGHSSHGSKKHR